MTALRMIVSNPHAKWIPYIALYHNSDDVNLGYERYDPSYNAFEDVLTIKKGKQLKISDQPLAPKNDKRMMIRVAQLPGLSGFHFSKFETTASVDVDGTIRVAGLKACIRHPSNAMTEREWKLARKNGVSKRALLGLSGLDEDGNPLEQAPSEQSPPAQSPPPVTHAVPSPKSLSHVGLLGHPVTPDRLAAYIVDLEYHLREAYNLSQQLDAEIVITDDGPAYRRKIVETVLVGRG